SCRGSPRRTRPTSRRRTPRGSTPPTAARLPRRGGAARASPPPPVRPPRARARRSCLRTTAATSGSRSRFYPKRLEPAIERAAAQAERARRLGHVAAEAVERARDEVALRGFERHRLERRAARARPEAEVRARDDAVVREEQRALHR